MAMVKPRKADISPTLPFEKTQIDALLRSRTILRQRQVSKTAIRSGLPR